MSDFVNNFFVLTGLLIRQMLGFAIRLRRTWEVE
jgi:hypothetical protein